MKNPNLKNSIKDNVVSVEMFNNQETESIGKVIKSNEKEGICTVNFIGADGNPSTVPNVVVRLDNPSIVAWFPKKNDYVIIRESGGVPIIVGDGTIAASPNKLKAKTKVTKDIYSMFSEVIGGFLI